MGFKSGPPRFLYDVQTLALGEEKKTVFEEGMILSGEIMAVE